MKRFLDDNFLLRSEIAEELYHDYAKNQPIIDYHNHLVPEQVARNINFENITQAWLYGDHYKWRAMRANGIPEEYITGTANDKDKFRKWAQTVPYTMRNPLYHWTHLELQRYFDIPELLNENSAEVIYFNSSAQLQTPSFSVHGLLEKMKVEVICTTDDPLDSLTFHQQLAALETSFQMLPAFRPDQAMDTEDLFALNNYITRLEEITNQTINTFDDYLTALKNRHDYFAQQGCRISDHGLEHLFAEDYTEKEISVIFTKIRSGQQLNPIDQAKFKSAMLVHFAEWDHEKGW